MSRLFFSGLAFCRMTKKTTRIRRSLGFGHWLLNLSSFIPHPSAFAARSIKVPSRRRYLPKRHGLTLVEVLVALTASLVLLGAVVSVLGMVSGSISDSRSMIESSGRLRSAQLLLRSDLAGATCNGLVWQKPEDNPGYIELIEGPVKDLPSGSTSLIGDTDDLLFMTVRSKDGQFSGTSPSGIVKSNLAEVVWFLVPSSTQTDPSVTTYDLHRRMFLIMPSTASAAIPSGAANTTVAALNGSADVSFRTVAGGGSQVLCTLGDLTNRANRVFHDSRATAFPHVVNVANNSMILPVGSGREGEDIVLSNVVAFDVRVFDPKAEVDTRGLLPGDTGYASAGGASVQRGGYVNLGSGTVTSPGVTTDGGMFTAPIPALSSPPILGAKSRLGGLAYQTFDTWSTAYENDGDDQDDGGSGDIDEGFDGLDNDGNGLIDDATERETSPPYPFPLRGIQIKIRIYEPNSGSVREVTIEETFMNR